MLDYIASLAVRILNVLFKFIPITLSLWFGRLLGIVIFFFNKKRRLIAYANLKAAFGKEKAPKELKKITRGVYQNMTQTFVEVLNLTKVSKKYVDRFVKVVNMERIEKASASPRGAILLTGHFGNWELSNLVAPIKGFSLVVLAREQKMTRLNELLNALRESKGCKVIRKGISTRRVLRALIDKETVGILADQDAGRNGVFVDFFGRPTSTSPGPMEFAKRSDSLVLPNFIVRVKGPYHNLFLEEYIDFRKSASGSEDTIKENTQRYVSLLESYVRRYPEQWLWLHKRWKSTPVRTVLVLNDGKTGHLNQSMAVAREIQRVRRTQGYGPEDTKVVVANVGYASNLRRTLLAITSSFSNWRCHGCMACMKYCLDRDSYENLMGTYCDFVISCGSSLAPVNVFMAWENNAKNVIVMSPGLVGLDKFDLAIIPRHDRPRAKGNVLVTEAAPNIVDEETMAYHGKRFREMLNLHGDRLRIGLLIGGDNPEFALGERLISRVIDNVMDAANNLHADILATTSRRTSRQVESVVKEKLKDHPKCRLLVIANEENPDGAVAGILNLSNVVVVSGESISMISEAISSWRPVVVFNPERKTNRISKHEKAVNCLKDSGYINIASPHELKDEIVKVSKDSRGPRRLEDRERIYEAMGRLI